jgi:hypothetical protein
MKMVASIVHKCNLTQQYSQHTKGKAIHMETLFTLETQMGKSTSNGA